MFRGELIGIYVAPRKGDDLQAVDEVAAVAGQGLAGDRYFLKTGTYSQKHGPDREVTLIEIEALDALERECKIKVEARQARRNLVTRGVPLNHLVGQEFSVGDVVLRGIRLCEPCGHLEKLTVKGIEAGLCHRGGLRAQIVTSGTLRAGAGIQTCAG
jgi:MOSC domain-containing protein YiiM